MNKSSEHVAVPSPFPELTQTVSTTATPAGFTTAVSLNSVPAPPKAKPHLALKVDHKNTNKYCELLGSDLAGVMVEDVVAQRLSHSPPATSGRLRLAYISFGLPATFDPSVSALDLSLSLSFSLASPSALRLLFSLCILSLDLHLIARRTLSACPPCLAPLAAQVPALLQAIHVISTTNHHPTHYVPLSRAWILHLPLPHPHPQSIHDSSVPCHSTVALLVDTLMTTH